MSSPVKSTVNIPSQTGDTQSPTFAWLEKNQKPVTYGLVALAVVVLGGWLFLETGKRKEIAANDAIDRARGAFESGNLPAASTEFQRIAESFRGTDAGWQAELALNEVRLASGQAQLAADELKKLAERNPPVFYASGAQFMLGGALENLKKFEEAAAAYTRAADQATEDYRQIEGRIGAARALRLAGKQPEALDILRAVIAKYPKDTPGVAEAEVRLAEWTAGSM
jgi:tetratricopeptide (TPR) repeat protein